MTNFCIYNSIFYLPRILLLKSVFIYRFCKLSVIQGLGLITSVMCVRFVSFSAVVKFVGATLGEF